MKTRQKALIAIALFAVSWLVVRFVIGGPEDSWICDHGQWVKHGNPSAEKPTTECPR